MFPRTDLDQSILNLQGKGYEYYEINDGFELKHCFKLEDGIELRFIVGIKPNFPDRVLIRKLFPGKLICDITMIFQI